MVEYFLISAFDICFTIFLNLFLYFRSEQLRYGGFGAALSSPELSFFLRNGLSAWTMVRVGGWAAGLS